ncbi:MAG TPA: discoidin domain-containing protein [Candidatus Acidoferrales bacterium]|nr:discoidin domain-containing protein [Candidatus Acidoferrales bacterium]
MQSTVQLGQPTGTMQAADELVIWGGETVVSERWRANAASGARATLGVEPGPRGVALRLDFVLAGPGSWVIARCEISLELPAHYVMTLRLRGDASPNELQVKLVDPSGASVWWWRRRDFTFPHEAQRLVLRRASLDFAWGPASGGEPSRIGAVEIALVAGQGGTGSLWVEDLRIEPREPVAGPPRACGIRASSFVAGHEPERVLDGEECTSWRPDPADACPWVELELGQVCEWGGLLVDFAATDATPATGVLASDDGMHWTTLIEEPGGAGGRRWLRTGEAESRFVRLELPAGCTGGITRVAVVPIELAVSPARWAAMMAKAAPRGGFPRHFLREQSYWAVVGADGDERKGLLSEDGAIEVDAEAFTVEPFLRVDGRLLTWADVEPRVSLADGCLPIPSVEWAGVGLRLRITAFATGQPGRSTLVARYEVENPGSQPRRAQLLLAIRPYQVTPAWQSLNLTGAFAPITHLAGAGARIRVNDTREVVAVSVPDGFGAVRGDEGVLEAGALTAENVYDPTGFAEGLLAFHLCPAPAGSEAVVVAVPLFEDTPPPPAGLARPEAAAWGAARLDEAVASWRARLAGIPIALPPGGARFEASLRASIAWILVNREGPRIQPGPRCYRRSWIRDGAFTGTALAEMGFAAEARAFLRWYAPHQLEDGRIPCAVDRRGVDLVAEHDSHGEFVWGVVELYRLTGDLGFLQELWPRVLRAVDAIAALRGERTGDAFRATACFGLLPESISHEGYASHPVHSYWDDFFAVRGLTDAAEAAKALGDVAAADRIGALRDAMRGDLHTSIARTMAQHRIDFLPGSVELGDFDPTSSAIAFDPCREDARLPRPALERTFERYWREFEARRRGETSAEAYTPYEIRNATALLGLGWKERALALLEWMIDDQRPPAWCQWPEVTTRNPRLPRFLGDLPHGWVASSFVRSGRRLFAWERDEDSALVVAAGVPETWVRERPGVCVHGLATHFGRLDFTMYADGDDCVRVTLGGGVRPPGGIVLVSPFARPLREVVVAGRPRQSEDSRCARVRELPADVVLRY